VDFETMIETGTQYHDETSYDRHDMSGHFLDWANQPMVFKDYVGIEPLPLPKDVALPERSLFSLLKEGAEKQTSFDITVLSRLLLLTNSLTAKARHPGGDFYYRGAASAGALYPTELYVASRGMDGLEDGLYHFAVHRHALYPLRQGDFASHILEATQEQGHRPPKATFFMTAILFRSAWKYRARSYRYHLLDTGHVAENLALALKAEGFPMKLSYDFDDQRVNLFLGIDGRKEVTLAVAHVFGHETTPPSKEEDIPELSEAVRNASVVSAAEVDYPAIKEIHQAGAERVKGTTTAVDMVRNLGIAPEGWSHPEDPLAWPEIRRYPDALFQRRSRRNFVKEALSREKLTGLLQALCAKDSGETASVYKRSVATGFLINRVEGTEEGFYLLDPAQGRIGPVAQGPFTEKMTRTCLDQMWLAHAAVHFLFLANLEGLDRTWGARGYRYAMLSAGRLGQRLYVAATAMGLGCCGIGALYDGEAAALLGLNEHSRLLYLVAVGVVKKM
jgi:SagB-type dehydrogenase family enzyme